MRVLLVAYKGWVKGEEKPFDEVPEEKPVAVIVGDGELIKGLEKALEKMKEGEEQLVELPPEEAFGKRDPEKVVIIPLREFQRRNIKPYPGLIIEADGKRGRVLSVSGGRVQVDFNHELAGKTVRYKIKVIKELKGIQEIAEAFFRRYFGRDPEKIESGEGWVLVVYRAGNVEKDTLNKIIFVSKMLKFVPEVRVEEIYKKNS